VVGFAGGNASSGGNAGSVYITLRPLSERKINVDSVIARLRQSTSKITGATLYMQAAQDLVIGGRTTSAQYQYTLAAENLVDLNTWAPIVLEKMLKIPGIIDVNSDQRSNGLQEFVTYDRDTASRLGLTTNLIDNTLYDAFGQRQISTMDTALNQYHVVMEVAPKYWQSPEILKDIYIANQSGVPIQLSTFAQFAPSNTLLVVNHQNQFPSATISFNLVPGLSLGDAVEKINQSVSEVQIPASIHGTFSGTAQAFQASLANQPYLIIAALLTVYIVLGILYESLIHPITILSTLPSAGVGALLALLICGIDLSIIAIIGIILLIGIVKKNAIMMIDFALQLEREHKLSPVAAIYKAAILRFRPIMMTTVAAIFGALPLALGSGVGSELRKPLGVAIIGGLLVSQMLTLYTTPVIYLAIEGLRIRLVKRHTFKMYPTTKGEAIS
jgi:multidrug efflux pump